MFTGQLGLASPGDFQLGQAETSNLISDTLILTDEFVAQTDFEYLVDSLLITESYETSLTYERLVEDTLVLDDSYEAFGNQVFSDTLTYTDDYEATISRVLSESLTLTDTVIAGFTLSTSTGEVLNLVESYTLNQIKNVSLDESIVFTETYDAFRVISDTLSFSESYTAIDSRALYDVLEFTESFVPAKSVGRVLNEILNLVDTLFQRKTLSVSLNEVLNFSESYGRFKQFNVSFDDTLDFDEQLFRERIDVIDENTLTFTDDFVSTMDRNRLLNDELSITETYEVSKTLNLPVMESLEFTEYLFGSKEDMVLMQGKFDVIKLPAPELNDFSNNESKLVVKRSMTGNYHTSVRRTNRTRHNWRFVISKPLSDRLYDFIQRESSNKLVVTDWRGQQWLLQFSGDSYEFTETGRWAPCGNRTEVTIELEGVRYYG